jgi:hypothetical protein
MYALKMTDFERFLFAVEPTAFHGEEPQLRFTFRLTAPTTNIGSLAFNGHEVEFTVKNGLIELANFRQARLETGLKSLKAVSRSEDDRTIVFEDQLGFYRMTLKLDTNDHRYQLSINHPNNTYLLDPVFIQG